MHTFILKQNPETYTYLRYPAETAGELSITPGATGFLACLRDSEAVTLIVDENTTMQYPLPSHLQSGFRALEIQGPLEFSLVGILKGLTTLLADRNIPVCALSTYDTDMLLVARKYLGSAIEAIEAAGHEVRRP